MSQALLIRCVRVFSCLADVIQCIQSRRAMVVVLSHSACAAGLALSAARKSGGISGSGSSATGAISSATRSPTWAPEAVRSSSLTRNQWLNWPSGSSVALNGAPLRVPATEVRPRRGSCSLTSLGRMTNVHGASLPAFKGRSNVAWNCVFLLACFIWNEGHSRPRSSWA